MNGKNRSFLDFLHDTIDYIIMLAIVIIVGVIIAWRLDLLFQKSEALGESQVLVSEEINGENTDSSQKKDPEEAEEGESITEEEIGKDKLEEKDPIKDKPGDKTQDKPDQSPKDENPTKDSTGLIKVAIPSGSTTVDIGKILEETGAINSSTEFIKACEELNMSSKLKAGNFSLKQNDSIENIISVLTK